MQSGAYQRDRRAVDVTGGTALSPVFVSGCSDKCNANQNLTSHTNPLNINNDEKIENKIKYNKDNNNNK
jgi:hypothetical protein